MVISVTDFSKDFHIIHSHQILRLFSLNFFSVSKYLCDKHHTFLLDQDGDKKLTLSEFISLPVGTVENQQAQDIDDDWVRERKKEFEDVIDSDKNGIVTMEELEVRRLL